MSGVGHLGELEVIDYLRKNLGHEIYLPLKDTGIDFMSTKNEKSFMVQVKTSIFQKNSYFWFDLHKNKLRFSRNIYYIFVCKSLGRRKFMQRKHNFLVIDSLQLKRWIKSGTIPTKKNNDNILNFFIYPNEEEKTWMFRNKGKTIELTSFWNNFSNFK